MAPNPAKVANGAPAKGADASLQPPAGAAVGNALRQAPSLGAAKAAADAMSRATGALPPVAQPGRKPSPLMLKAAAAASSAGTIITPLPPIGAKPAVRRPSLGLAIGTAVGAAADGAKRSLLQMVQLANPPSADPHDQRPVLLAPGFRLALGYFAASPAQLTLQRLFEPSQSRPGLPELLTRLALADAVEPVDPRAMMPAPSACWDGCAPARRPPPGCVLLGRSFLARRRAAP
jgi:hypothetical protein